MVKKYSDFSVTGLNRIVIGEKEDYIVIMIMKSEVKDKLYSLGDTFGVSFFIALVLFFASLFLVASSQFFSSNWKIIISVSLFLVFYAFYHIINELIGPKVDNLKFNRRSYEKIYRYKVLPSKITNYHKMVDKLDEKVYKYHQAFPPDKDFKFLNGDDLVWCAGVLFPLYSTRFDRERMKSILTLDGYKLEKIGYVTEDNRENYKARSHIPILITVNGMIYPLIDLNYFFDSDYMSRTETARYIESINEIYNLPNRPDYSGRTEPYDLITDIGYIILKSKLPQIFAPNRKPVKLTRNDHMFA